MLPIIFFSVLFGLGITVVGEKGKTVFAFFEGGADAMFWVTNIIMKFCPIRCIFFNWCIGVKIWFRFIDSTWKTNDSCLCNYALFYCCCAWRYREAGLLLIFSTLKLLKDELLLAYSTSSSETVLPKVMHKMEKFRCPKNIVSFVVPTGYSFNLDDSTLYQALATPFIAQIYEMIGLSDHSTPIYIIL